MEWIGKIIIWILALLVGSLLFLLGLHFVNDLFHFWPVYVDSIEPCDKFEVFRDLLLILLAALGAAGYFTYRQIRSKLEEDLQKSIKEHENQIFGKLYYHLSFAHWREYEKIDTTEPRYEELCNLAIEEVKNAIRYYEELDDKKHEGRINYYKMTLAYNLAVQKKPEDKDEALMLARENWIKAIKFKIDQEYNIRESRAWVTLKYSDDNSEKEKAKEELKNLMKWKTVPNDWKDKIKEKYIKEFDILLN